MTKQPDFTSAREAADNANRAIREAWAEVAKAVRLTEQRIIEAWKKGNPQ